MAKKDYLPSALTGRRQWLQNWNTKLPGVQTNFQLPTSAITETAADFLAYDYLLAMKEEYTTYVQNLNAQIKQLTDGEISALVIPFVVPPTPLTMPAAIKSGIVVRLRATAKRIKAHSNYSIGAGEDLGIEGPDQAAPIGAPPSFKLVAQNGFNVRINWQKGQASGVIIQSRRGAEVAWTQIGIDLNSPFIDIRPPLVAETPETREYRLIYMKNDQPIGVYSNPISILAVP